jgi:DNA-binding transcriptional MerR regulator
MSIGELARRVGLSVKALRLYGAKGLLRPSVVDPVTGYRYYSGEELKRAQQLKLLRSLKMPLAEIQAVLRATDRESVRRRLDRYRLTVEAQIEDSRQVLLGLQDLIDGKGEKPMLDAAVREVPDLAVAAIELDQVLTASDLGRAFSELYGHLSHVAVAPADAPFLSFPEADIERRQRFRVCVPVTGAVQPGARVRPLSVPGGQFAATLHAGDYAKLPEVMGALSAWCDARGLRRGAELRNVYRVSLATARDTRELRTEVLWRLASA